MTDSEWGEEIIATVRKYAMQNAIEYNGKGQSGSVLGRLLGERKDLRSKARDLKKLVEIEVAEANLLAEKKGVDVVKEKLAETNPEALQRQKQKKRVGLKPLTNAIDGGVVLRFAPNPNGPLTIGHARGIVINSEYARNYSGKVVLRFDDTDTRVKPPLPEAYAWISEEYEWLAGRPADITIIASERMPLYLNYAKQMIGDGFGYVCRCSASEFKKLRDQSRSCPCRERSVDDNLNDWESMIVGEIKEGGAVVRVKTNLELANPALRDWPALRIQHTPHPMVGDKYKVWPLLDFQSAIEDHLQGVTHIVRGKDLMDSTRKQTLLYEHFGWIYPETLYWGRVKVHEFGSFSTSQMRSSISEGDYSGWDDIRLPTLSALRKRGFDPKALKEFWIDLGLTQKDISISMQTIESFNSSIIDDKCERRSFVRNPVSFNIDKGELTSKIPESLLISRHPDELIEGERIWNLGSKIFVEQEDCVYTKIRLKDFADVFIEDGNAIIESMEKGDRRLIAHWIPEGMEINAVLHIPNGNDIELVHGLLENYEIKEGMIIQLERVGFAKIDEIQEDNLVSMIYLHG
tara:strand:+ start:16783 stop:18507 length:1725 start_codon:yes stop_codon:yes gene_type:complete